MIKHLKRRVNQVENIEGWLFVHKIYTPLNRPAKSDREMTYTYLELVNSHTVTLWEPDFATSVLKKGLQLQPYNEEGPISDPEKCCNSRI